MLYVGEFYIADEEESQKEVIAKFMEDDGYKSLLIIHEHLGIEYIKMLREDYNCFVVFLNANSDPLSEPRKIIYIHDTFDTMAKDFVFNKWGLVAFFE